MTQAVSQVVIVDTQEQQKWISALVSQLVQSGQFRAGVVQAPTSQQGGVMQSAHGGVDQGSNSGGQQSQVAPVTGIGVIQPVLNNSGPLVHSSQHSGLGTNPPRLMNTQQTNYPKGGSGPKQQMQRSRTYYQGLQIICLLYLLWEGVTFVK